MFSMAMDAKRCYIHMQTKTIADTQDAVNMLVTGNYTFVRVNRPSAIFEDPAPMIHNDVVGEAPRSEEGHIVAECMSKADAEALMLKASSSGRQFAVKYVPPIIFHNAVKVEVEDAPTPLFVKDEPVDQESEGVTSPQNTQSEEARPQVEIAVSPTPDVATSSSSSTKTKDTKALPQSTVASPVRPRKINPNGGKSSSSPATASKSLSSPRPRPRGDWYPPPRIIRHPELEPRETWGGRYPPGGMYWKGPANSPPSPDTLYSDSKDRSPQKKDQKEGAEKRRRISSSSSSSSEDDGFAANTPSTSTARVSRSKRKTKKTQKKGCTQQNSDVEDNASGTNAVVASPSPRRLRTPARNANNPTPGGSGIRRSARQSSAKVSYDVDNISDSDDNEKKVKKEKDDKGGESD